MPIAAVPSYLGKDFLTASPGLRFGMYLKLWGVNSRSQAKLWTTFDENYRPAGRDRQERLFKDENKGSALRDAVPLTRADVQRIDAIVARQVALRATVPGDALLHLPATAVAPFATGFGNEHPLENGFAFLNPYGLPYLAGSGVKGVLRQAAWEMSRGNWGDRRGWSNEHTYPLRLDGGKILPLSMLDVLFGRETDSGDTEHLRGVLSFWDVIPQITTGKLHVEVMTPHQTHYYQHGQSPHDSGQPNPILFLTVPPGSKFEFHVVCNLPALRRLAPALAEDGRWKQLMQGAFEHAFAWLGFGAKTAVGYGALEFDQEAERRSAAQRHEREQERERERKEAERKAALAAMDPVDRAIQELLDAWPDKNQPAVSALISAMKQGRFDQIGRIEVAKRIREKMRAQNRWREKSAAKKPEKDRDYQDTLLVRSWLEGK
jgi:CRISPR-associated protein Cmr6